MSHARFDFIACGDIKTVVVDIQLVPLDQLSRPPNKKYELTKMTGKSAFASIPLIMLNLKFKTNLE